MRVLFIFLFTFNTFAHTDLSAGGALRTYPSLGAEVNAQIGYNFLLWGKGPGQNKKNYMFGLLRPSINFNSSSVINGYDARLEFYPISFIGLAAGKRTNISNYDGFSFFNCEQVRCIGTLNRNYQEFKMALIIKKLVAVGTVVVSNNTYSDEDNERRPVAEFRFAMLANPKEDKLYRSQYIFGLSHSNNGIFGIAAEYVGFDKSGQTHNMDLLIYTTKAKKTTYIFGIGQFSSTHQPKGLIGVFQMRTDFLPSSKLF